MIAITRQRPDFEVGQLVQHRRYGYRGVIVEVDLECRAPQDWYQKNQTQPDRRQPWYHVLVDGGTNTTYAAQTSLLADGNFEPIDNPLVSMFFHNFEAGFYERNEVPWKGW